MPPATRPVVISANTTYFIDGQNTTGCASDSNNGTSATCGAAGVGPFKTYSELHDQYWGGTVPIVRSATLTVSLISAMAANDWGAFDVACDQCNGIVLNATTNGTSIATGTISNVAALNRTVGVGTLSEVQMPAPSEGFVNAASGYPLTTPTPQLVVDTTTPSKWWVYKQQSGSVYYTTDPVVTFTAPAAIGTLYSKATPVNVDTVTLYHPITAQFYRISVNMINWDVAQNGGVWVQGLRFLQGSAPGVITNVSNDLVISSYVNLLDCASDRTIVKLPTGGHDVSTIQNVFAFNLEGGSWASGAPGGYQQAETRVVSGAVFEGSAWHGARNSLLLDGDVIMRDARLGGVRLGCAYLDSSAVWQVESNGLTQTVGLATGFCTSGTQASLWSLPSTPYSIDVSGGARLSLTSGATQNLRNAGTLTICGQGVACNGSGAALPANCNIALSVANLAAASGAAGFGNQAWVPGCGSIGTGDSAN